MAEYFKNINLRRKLMLSYITVVIIPLVFLGGFSFHKARENVYENYVDYMQNDLNTFSDELNQKMDYMVMAVNNLAFNNANRANLERTYLSHYDVYTTIIHSWGPLLSSVKVTSPNVCSVQFYTSNPMLRKTGVCEPLENLERFSWFNPDADYIEGHFFLDGDTLYLIQSVPHNNQTRSYVLLTSSIKELIVSPVHWQDSCNWGLYAPDGGLVLSGVNGDIRLPEVKPELHEYKNSGSLSCTMDGMFVIQSQVPLLGMDVLLLDRNGLSHNAASQILWGTLGIVLCCIVLVLLVSSFLSRKLSFRMEYLSAQLSRFKAGNMNIQIHADADDEIGMLSKNLDSLLQTVRKLICDIYKAEKSRKDAEIQMFHAMIKPHFLYNIFSIINWKALADGNEQISQVALSAATYYRTVLNSGQQTITVGKELDGVRAYLEIQQIMHDHSFSCTYCEDPNATACKMPCFILQPIVENAVKHGLENKRIGKGMLSIHTLLQKNSIVFEIRDNGPGMPSEVLEKLKNGEFTGYGLKNISQKLKFYYGGACTLDISSDPFSGTTVVLTIPSVLPERSELPSPENMADFTADFIRQEI